MTQEEKRKYLIQALLDERPEYTGYQIPDDEKSQKDLLRALCNTRPKGEISDEFVRIQEDYLRKETEQKGITDVDDLTPVPSDSRLYLWQGDITTIRCDAIVNAANSRMLGCFQPLHGCIDNMIHTMAGVRLRNECADKMHEDWIHKGIGPERPTAMPLITSGCALPAKYVIHVVGPIVTPFLQQKHKDQLAECYRACLDLAAENGCESIAFCCISTGVFMFPQGKAAEIAVRTVREWLDGHPDSPVKKVVFNVFKDSDLGYYRELLGGDDRRGFRKISV